MLINPIYAVSIDPDLMGSHEPIVSKERWIEANEKLMDKIGTETWLRRLLAVLKGDYPTSPDDQQSPTATPAITSATDAERQRNRRCAARRSRPTASSRQGFAQRQKKWRRLVEKARNRQCWPRICSSVLL